MKKAIVIAIFVVLMTAITASAVTLEYNTVMTGKDVSLVKGFNEYKGVTNETVTRHEEYIYSVNQATFKYNSTASITDFHEVTIETELEGVRAPYSGIGGTEYIENVGSGDNKSCCVFGIMGSAHNLTVASIVGIQPLTLTQTYVIEAGNGEAGTSYVKRTENITAEGTHTIRGKEAFVAGQYTCIKFPAGPAKDGKPSFCVWQGKGIGYPMFSDTRGNETAPTYSYYIRGRLNVA